MADVRTNIFGIGEVYELQREGQWVEKNRESYREYGYFGGSASPVSSTVDRIDYSNDTATASIRGPLSLARGSFAATGNSNFGYFGGGSIPAVVSCSTVDRIDYSNDSAQASPRGPLSISAFSSVATGNSNFGYWSGGGSTSPSVNTSYTQRIDYSND